MRKIYGIGEALLDVIFRNNQPIGATAGGSTLNAIVSLGRMGHQPFLISEIGNDRIGDIIDEFLVDNGVSDQYLFRKKGNRSPLALAFLNEKNDAEYEIFKDYSAQSLNGELPPFKENDIVTFGSFFSLNPALRPQLKRYINAAKNAGAIIVYDPNYRSHHAHKTNHLLEVIEENFSFAHIVRGSNEDFNNIYGLKDESKMAERIKNFCNNVIITANANGVFLSTSKVEKWYPTPIIQPVSTIGAGDNFNAGLIHGIMYNNITKNNIHSLTPDEWEKILIPAIAFASEVCCSLDNYIPKDYIPLLIKRSSEIKELFNVK